MKRHKGECADVCINCEMNGKSTTECRQDLQHDERNAISKKNVEYGGLDLPQCCMRIAGLHAQCYSALPEKLKSQTVIGYMIPYNEATWQDWFQQFVLQSQCEYTARNGSKTNSQSREKGVIKVNEDYFTYTSSWVHTYNCLRGGKGKFNPLSLKKKSRVSIGTRRLGCGACVHTRLLHVSNGMEVLEIKIPLLSAHLPVHNPLSVSDQLTMKPLPEVEHKVEELVQECFLNQRALRIFLKSWVEKELVPKHIATGVITESPSEYNRAYHPTKADIRVMVTKVMTRQRDGLFDQDATLQLLQKYEKTTGLKYHFCPYNNKAAKSGL